MSGITLKTSGRAIVIAACMAIMFAAIGAAEPIRIGAILSLTGSAAANGQGIRDGILLAVEEINKRGGVNGNKIDVEIVDSKGDPQAAVEAFNRMELARPPLFYLSFLSTVGVALGPLTDGKNVVLVGLSTSAPAFTRGRQLVYQYWPLAQADSPPLIRILRDLNARKLGIIYSNEEFGVAEQVSLSRAFADAGGMTTVQPFEAADTDFQRQVEALMSQDAVFVATFGANILSIVRQLKDAKYRGAILTPNGGGSPAFAAAPEMQGVYVAAPIIYNPAYLFAREAGAKISARYQKPLDQWSASGYDFIKLISGLLEDRPLTREGVRDVFATGFDYSGVFGPVRLKPGEHIIAFPIYPAQILNNSLDNR